MHAPDGSCRKPAGARAPVTGGTGGHRALYQRPTAGVAAARPQANPDVGGGACPPAGIGAPPWRGAPQPGRRGPPSGAGRDAAFPVAYLVTSGRWDARPPTRAWAMATARPMAARRALRGRRRAEWVGNGTTGRGRKPRRDECWTRGQGSARFCCPMAARATAEIGRAACLMPPTGLSLRKSLFFCESVALVARATIRKRSAFAQARNGSLGVGLLPFLGARSPSPSLLARPG